MNPKQINVLLFGASGMVGQGVLRECLKDPAVGKLTTIGRSGGASRVSRINEIIHADLLNYAAVENELTDFDACFFCLGISSAGLTEQAYRRVTFDIALAAAGTLARLNPNMTFIYVSGAGTDSSAAGRVMWARVKGETENALLALPCHASFMLRPGIIRPLDGIQSKTRSYRLFYALCSPLLPLLQALLPNLILSTRQMGLAMLNLAQHGYPKSVLESRDIRIAAERRIDPPSAESVR